MYAFHLLSLKTKMFKNVHDVCKLVLGGTSVPKPILLTFRGRKMVKICGKFKVKTSWYYSPRTNQGPLRWTLVFEDTGPGQWAST